MHYLLSYELAPDYLERRGELRSEHLQLAWRAQQAGTLVLAGTLADPVDLALLLFQGDSPDVAQQFAKADPYVIAGLVVAYQVRQWNTVVGELAFSPVRP